MRRAAIAVTLFAAACGATANPAGNPDLSTAPGVDLAGGGEVDLARVRDLGPRPDLTTTATEDLSSSTDDLSSSTNDLAGATADMTGGGYDLSVVAAPDLAPRPDLLPAPDMTPPVAFGATCTASSTCAAPANETGFCSLGYGTPICLSTCDTQADYSLCAGGAGICLPTGSGKVCVPKCGDSTNTTCGPGASCAFLGYRGTNPYYRVGGCLPDCDADSASTHGCKTAGRSCDTFRRFCVDNTCPGGCLPGSTCTNGVCSPASPSPLYGACTPSTTSANGCASNLCFSAGATPGFCGQFCNTANAATVCGAGGYCWTDNTRDLQLGQASGGTLGGPPDQFAITGGRTSGACTKKCTTSADCPTGFYCGDREGVRACILGTLPTGTPPPTGTGTPGALCRADSDCASGACDRSAGWLDGVCLKATAATCPATTIDLGSNVCLTACDPTDTLACPGSLVCVPLSATEAVCAPGFVCRSDADCTAGYTCDAQSGSCQQAPHPGNGVGQPCGSDAACASNFCLTPRASSPTYTGGYCSAGCTILPDFSDTCPAEAFCLADTIGSYGNCFDLCDRNPGVSRYLGCRTGYTCVQLSSETPDVGVCRSN
jgi:hypothetical protein